MDQAERQLLLIEFKHAEVRVPETLFNLCLENVCLNLETLVRRTHKGFALRRGLVLPRDICEPLIEMYQKKGHVFCNHFAYLFSDVTKTNIRSLKLSYASISDDGLEYLLKHNLYDITLTHCPNLTVRAYINIFKHAKNLRSLNISPIKIMTRFNKLLKYSWTTRSGPYKFSQNAPNLKSLVLQGTDCTLQNIDNSFLNFMLADLSQLKILDISHSIGLKKCSFLSRLNNLHTLIMFNVPHLEEKGAIPIICTLQSLVVLDISQTVFFMDSGIYKDGDKTLELLIESLPNLMSLDISGTNLDGDGTFNNCESLIGKQSDIPGLQRRVNNPLEFLGLYRTKHDACQRQSIPAKIISGHANEKQFLNAAASCMKKPIIMEYILSDILHFMSAHSLEQKDEFLKITLELLTNNVKFKPLQTIGNNLLTQLVGKKDEQDPTYTPPLLLKDISVRRRIVTIILTALQNYGNDQQLICSALYILNKLEIPKDIMFQFKSVVEFLLRALAFNSLHQFYYRKVGINLLQSVAFGVNIIKRDEIGNAGAIKELMKLIKGGLFRTVCTYIFENAWTCMWLLCDEVPTNCERFLNENGMKYFLGYLAAFPEKTNLLQIAVGLVSNVAQWKTLRFRLMNIDYIRIFSDLSIKTLNGFEVSFYAARIIVYLFYNGNDKTWPKRQEVLDRLIQATTNWEQEAHRLINLPFNPVESLLGIAQVRRVPQCTYWAAWTLANLAKLNPEISCSTIIANDGLKILSDLLEEPEITKNFAQQTITICENFLENAGKPQK